MWKKCERINYFCLGGPRKGFTGQETIETDFKDEKELIRDEIAGRGKSQFKGMVVGETEKKEFPL